MLMNDLKRKFCWYNVDMALAGKIAKSKLIKLMSFTKSDLDNIKSKISIRSELEKKTKIIQKGSDFWCCCPFHEEKTPSCKINEDQASFYCFGCGAKGDIFTLYTDLYNYTFLDAVKELSQQVGIKINFERYC